MQKQNKVTNKMQNKRMSAAKRLALLSNSRPQLATKKNQRTTVSTEDKLETGPNAKDDLVNNSEESSSHVEEVDDMLHIKSRGINEVRVQSSEPRTHTRYNSQNDEHYEALDGRRNFNSGVNDGLNQDQNQRLAYDPVGISAFNVDDEDSEFQILMEEEIAQEENPFADQLGSR